MNKTPQIVVIGENPMFPWKNGDKINCSDIAFLPEQKYHKIILDNEEYFMQIVSTVLDQNNLFIECFLSSDEKLGRVAFKLTY